MKSKFILGAALLSLVLSSCAVKSLQPFYKENDLIFDKNLIGTWLDGDSVKWYVKQIYVSYGEGDKMKEYRNNGYVVGRESKKDNESQAYDVFLFKINGQMYADISVSMFPTFSFDYEKIQSHNLAKVNSNKDELELTLFNGEWLAGLIETNKIRIAHEFVKFPEPISLKYKGEYILTAPTDELQKFISKYGSDPKAFAPRTQKLDDGTYKWNSGKGAITGKMHFANNSKITTIKLKKINDKNNDRFN